ncbi:MAG: potassium transporter TrkG [Caldicoprobacterales bacterium]
MDEEVLSGVMAFFFVYFAVFAASAIVLSLDNKDMVSTTTAVIACLSNIGPGLGTVGPAGNFADFSNLGKAVLSLCMIVGRLEIYPILLLFRSCILEACEHMICQLSTLLFAKPVNKSFFMLLH